MKLIDTDIAIDHFHGHRETFEYFTQTLIDGETLAMSVVSLTEILAGMRAGEQEKTEKLFNLFVNERCADRCSILAGKIR